jgi:hypothetical protein
MTEPFSRILELTTKFTSLETVVVTRSLVGALEFDDLAAGALDADVGDGVTLSFQGDLRFPMRRM